MGDSGRFRITHDQRHYHYLASSQVPSGYRRWTADTDAAPYRQHDMRAFLDGGAHKRSKLKSLPTLLIAQLGNLRAQDHWEHGRPRRIRTRALCTRRGQGAVPRR